MRYVARAPLRVDFGGGWTDVPFFAEAEGGAVLNAAITRYVRGYIANPAGSGPLARLRGDRSYLHYELDVPSGAGLGASAAQTVLWVTLVKTAIANVTERSDLAEIACQIAANLGILGGKQDEYASALGGIHYFTFGDAVRAERLDLGPFGDELTARLVLVYSGERRLSSSIHEHVWERYRAGHAPTVDALRTLKRLAGEMKEALLGRDLDGFGLLLGENWKAQRSLHPSVSDGRLENIFALASRSGAVGGKACGAGGGGCLVFLSAQDQGDTLRAAFLDKKLRIFDFAFDSYGVHLTRG